MQFYDAHNHLQAKRFAGRQTELLAACKGLSRMVVNGCSEEDWPEVAALAKAHPQVLPSFGYHPWFIHKRTDNWERELKRFLDAHTAAVGEIGLDRWKEGLAYKGQEEAFTGQLRIAAERNLPVSIHCLKAWGHLLELLEQGTVPARGFLLHSYGGSAEMIPPLAKLGAYFSFPGYYLREAKRRQREAFTQVPSDRLLIETDAPDQLLPAEYQEHTLNDPEGTPINHPANIGAVYCFMARMLDIRVKALEEKDPERKKLAAELAQLKKARPRATTALVMSQRKSPRVTRRFIQGNFTRPAETVKPGVPEILHAFPETESADRLDFARWVTSSNNPLMARVTINRMWSYYFGKGIVETENDFGTQGAPPSHPKLLDWLATEFVRSQWSRKAMHRLIVTSATYQQSSNRRADLAKADPYNKLLGRQSRLRLDAEILRDNALTASGLLSTKMGGPGVFPPQPPGCMNLGQHRKKWTASTGEDRYRRAVYTYRWRATPHPALKVFDTPDAFVSCTRRIRSNTPLQALTLLNDPAFFEIAQGLAERILREGGKTDEKRIALGVRLCLVREPDIQEVPVLKSFLDKQRDLYANMDAQTQALVAQRTHGHAVRESYRSEQAAWIMLARVLLNLDETITRE